MSDFDDHIFARLSEALDQGLSGSCPTEISDDSIGEISNPVVNEFIRKFVFFNKQYRESYKFIMELARGRLDTEVPARNVFSSPFKQLHAELRYLTWQIQQIADGDYDQRVSFSGDFSESINKMIVALRERQTLAEQLKESNATKDKLFSIIAHDLRSPFSSIVGFSEILLNEVRTSTPEEIEEYARVIYTSSTQAYDLLTNLLEWSRLQQGRIEVLPQLLDLKFVIQSNIRIANMTAEPKNITINYKDPAHYLVTTDNTVLNTIFRNLIGNAVKYTPENGHINLSVEVVEEFYHISITDDGIGMSEEDMEKLFRTDVVYSTPGTNSEKGTGLGLILCRDFVQMIGGDIWVKSTKGEGATFTFSIPLSLQSK